MYWNGHGMTPVPLWSSVMIMQNIRMKQAEGKWSLHEYNCCIVAFCSIDIPCNFIVSMHYVVLIDLIHVFFVIFVI